MTRHAVSRANGIDFGWGGRDEREFKEKLEEYVLAFGHTVRGAKPSALQGDLVKLLVITKYCLLKSRFKNVLDAYFFFILNALMDILF